MDKDILARSAVLFASMANPTRLKIVERLIAEPSSVNDIAHLLNIGQSGASQHLAILTRAGVLAVQARGTTRLYKVRGPRIEQIVHLIQEFCTVHDLYGDEDVEVHPEHVL